MGFYSLQKELGATHPEKEVEADIDHAIMLNEIHLRSQNEQAIKSCVKLSDLAVLLLLVIESGIGSTPGVKSIVRRPMREWALEDLGILRPLTLPLHITNESFAFIFNGSRTMVSPISSRVISSLLAV